jgi:hypothetical protein
MDSEPWAFVVVERRGSPEGVLRPRQGLVPRRADSAFVCATSDKQQAALVSS